MKVFSSEKFKKIKSKEAPEKKHTILVVDDEEANLRVLETVLGSDYIILKALDGIKALELIRSLDEPGKISLIISDQRMPHLSGVAFFVQAKNMIPETVRILLTGYVDIASIIDSINHAKIFQYLTKPFDRRELVLMVQRAIEAFEMKKELDAYVFKLEEKVRARTQELEEKNEALKEAYRQLEVVSLTDPLTSLRNRRYLLKYLEDDTTIAVRKYEEWNASNHQLAIHDSDLTFFMLDLDYFKAVNDTYGHAAGDKVLVEICDIMRHVFRDSDYLVRWGGEEFLVVTRFMHRDGASQLAERMRKAVESHDFDLGEGTTIKKTCSIGFASFPFFP